MKKHTEKHPSADETAADLPMPEASDTNETASPEAAPPAAQPAGPSEVDVLKDRLLRLQADFDNFRRRSARERAEWQVFALEQIIQDLIVVVDHYELGLATADRQQTAPSVREGFKLVYDQLLNVLKKHGVSPVSATPGEPFDPHTQEAISHVPSEEHPADVIIAETRKGYKAGDKMIRPVQVVVSSGPASTTESNEA